MIPGKLYQCVDAITVWPAECKTIDGNREIVQFKLGAQNITEPIWVWENRVILFLRADRRSLRQ